MNFNLQISLAVLCESTFPAPSPHTPPTHTHTTTHSHKRNKQCEQVYMRTKGPKVFTTEWLKNKSRARRATRTSICRTDCVEECRATGEESLKKDFLYRAKKPLSLIGETGTRLVGLVQSTLPILVAQPFSLVALWHSLYGQQDGA